MSTTTFLPATAGQEALGPGSRLPARGPLPARIPAGRRPSPLPAVCDGHVCTRVASPTHPETSASHVPAPRLLRAALLSPRFACTSDGCRPPGGTYRTGARRVVTATSPPRAEFFRRVDSVSSTGRDGAAAVLPMALDDDGISVCVGGRREWRRLSRRGLAVVWAAFASRLPLPWLFLLPKGTTAASTAGQRAAESDKTAPFRR